MQRVVPKGIRGYRLKVPSGRWRVRAVQEEAIASLAKAKQKL